MSQGLGRSDTGELQNFLGSVAAEPLSDIGRSEFSGHLPAFRRFLNFAFGRIT
jgi:hypothetical protein